MPSIKLHRIGKIEAKHIPVYYSGGSIMNVRDKLIRLADWCNGELELNDTITFEGPNGPSLANMGDWLIKHPDAGFGVYFTVLSDQMFKTIYGEVG